MVEIRIYGENLERSLRLLKKLYQKEILPELQKKKYGMSRGAAKRQKHLKHLKRIRRRAAKAQRMKRYWRSEK